MHDWGTIAGAVSPIADTAVDWTVVVTTLLGALSATIGAGLGYITARRAADVELRKVQAENERLRIQHGEEHLRHRQAVYHDFLDSALNFHLHWGGEDPFESVAARADWLRVHEHNLTAVCLFGTEPAWKAAQGLGDLMNKAWGASPDEYLKEHEADFLAQWDLVIKAMRPDTAPADLASRVVRGSPPSEWRLDA